MLRRMIILAVLCCACGTNRTPPGSDLDAPALTCLPDLDGTIQSAELAPAYGVTATFLVSTAARSSANATASSAPWDLTAPAADDIRVAFSAVPLGTQWYAASFPGARFVVPLDPNDTIEGVYAVDDTALWLYGTASHDPSPAEGQTLRPYVSPVAVYRFPIVDGAAHMETGVVAAGAKLKGLPYQGQDVYDVHVDGRGQISLPDVAFTDALRVRTTVTVEPAIGAHITRRQVSFLFDCFGEVARFTSADDEPSDDFTTAAEVRRFAL
jgi:hypothetical protein